MLGDIKIKNRSGKTIAIGRFESIRAIVEHNKKRLQHADLRGAVLTDAVLTRAVLTDADLRGAVLTDADLRGAVLTRAVLTDAVLTDAVLTDAVLTDAVLTRAVLTRAVLTDAVLTDAVLTDADLRGAVLDFSSVPLRCGFTRMKVCNRFVAQLAYHLTRQDHTACSDEVREEIERIKKGPLGNLFLNYRNDLEAV